MAFTVPVDTDHPLGAPPAALNARPRRVVNLRKVLALVLMVVGVGVLVTSAFLLHPLIGLGSIGGLALALGVTLAYEDT